MWLTLTHHTAQEKVAIMSADSDFYKSVNEDDTRVYVVVVSVCVCVFLLLLIQLRSVVMLDVVAIQKKLGLGFLQQPAATALRCNNS